jgi:hypothetical protein
MVTEPQRQRGKGRGVCKGCGLTGGARMAELNWVLGPPEGYLYVGREVYER